MPAVSPSSSTINTPHTRVAKLDNTVPWYQSRIHHKIPVSKGLGLLAVGAGFAVYDIGKTIKNMEGGISSFVNVVSHGLFWLVGLGPWTYFSMEPKNLPQVNLFNNYAKKISKNISENISKSNCFANVLSQTYINKLDEQTNSLLDKSFDLMKRYLEEKENNKEKFTDNESQNQILEVLKAEILSINYSGKPKAKILKDCFERLFHTKDLFYGFCKLSVNEPELVNYIKQSLFVSEIDDSDKQHLPLASDEINNIRNCINEVLIPVGLKLTPIQYDSTNDCFEICVVPIEGLSANNNKPDSLITLAGALIRINPLYFGFRLDGLVNDLATVSKMEIAKQYRAGTATQEQITTLNKKILSQVFKQLKLLDKEGLIIEAVETEYNPKTNDYSLTHTGLKFLDLVNGYSSKELKNLYKQLAPEFYKTTIADGLDRGLDSGLTSVPAGGGPSEESPGNSNYDLGDSVEGATARKFTSRYELNKELLIASRMSDVLSKLPFVDFRSSPSESDDVRELKYCFARIAAQNTAIEKNQLVGNSTQEKRDKLFSNRAGFVKFIMDRFKEQLPYLKNNDYKKISIPVSSNSKYKLPDKLVKLDYFFTIIGTNSDDQSSLRKISSLLDLIDEKQKESIIAEYNQRFVSNNDEDNKPVELLPDAERISRRNCVLKGD